MESSDYTQKMNDLRDKVSKYVQQPVQKETKTIKNNGKSYYFYIVPPCFILIMLIICKPSFIITEYNDEKGIVSKKLNYKNLIIAVLIGSLILDIGLFVYFKKTHKI
jgi:hypothetical protein